MSTPNPSPMSPAQAAHHAKVSRRTIMRAIESHELKATRNNRNHWKISIEDLDEWLLDHCTPTDHAHPDLPTLPTPEIPAGALELVAVKVENEQLKYRLETAEKDRDHWRAMAENLADRKRSFWPWWRRSK